MSLFKDILDRVSGVHATNQKLEVVVKQSEHVMATILNHESRITRLETLIESSRKQKVEVLA